MMKNYGGLEILDIKDLNLCLLGSWIKRYIMNENKPWRSIVEGKYCQGGYFSFG
jgi:hypothetical protein